MVSIILAVILAIIFTSVSVQNPTVVPLSLLGTTFSIPLYLFAAISFLTGILLSLLFHLFDKTASAVDLHAKDSRIREVSRANEDLQAQMQRISVENSELREKLAEAQSTSREAKVESTKANVKNFFNKARAGLS
jgi:uncharacterized integral membrane protein